MNVRMMPIVLLLVLLSAFVPVLAEAQYQTEIAIQGPWILYQDKQFTDSKGNTIPVLIAIAPEGAIDYKDLGYSEDNDPDMRYHRPPQLSTGDGYYIAKRNVYCLAFFNTQTNSLQCNPGAPNSAENYLPEETIKLPHGSGHWQWWTVAAKDNGQTALILPMPDSISNNGTWPVKFAQQFDEEGNGYWPDGGEYHSVGLILHYKTGPAEFGLTMCNTAPANNKNFGVNDCTSMAAVGNNRTDTRLINSGMLRIEMKAPYDADGCDLHVRMAHRQMAYLLGDFVGKYSFIEPAYYVDSDHTAFDNAVTHPCLTEELENIGSDFALLSYMNAGTIHAKNSSEESFPPTLDELDALLKDFTLLWTDLGLEVNLSKSTSNKGVNLSKADSDKYDLVDVTLAEQSVKQTRAVRQSLNVDFPRISQIRRIATLLQMSNQAIARVRSQPVNRTLPKSWIDLLRIHHQLDAENGPGKSAGDCLAPLIQVVDNP